MSFTYTYDEILLPGFGDSVMLYNIDLQIEPDRDGDWFIADVSVGGTLLDKFIPLHKALAEQIIAIANEDEAIARRWADEAREAASERRQRRAEPPALRFRQGMPMTYREEVVR